MDPPPGLGPAHDRVALRLGQRRVTRRVLQGAANRQQSAPLRAAWMLTRERDEGVVGDHVSCSAQNDSLTRLLTFATPTLTTSSTSCRSPKCAAARSNVARDSVAVLVSSIASAIAAFSASLKRSEVSARVIVATISPVMP